MNASISTLCDYAAELEGKLVITGTFDSIGAPEFPTVRPCMYVLRFHSSSRDAGQKRIQVFLTDQTGQPIGETVNLDFQVEIEDPSIVASRNLILNVPLRFEAPGQYSVMVQSEGVNLVSTPLSVFQLPTAPGAMDGEGGSGEA